MRLTAAPALRPRLQRKTLALIGASRRRGALQSDLATSLGVENRNFFYVVKVRVFLFIHLSLRSLLSLMHACSYGEPQLLLRGKAGGLRVSLSVSVVYRLCVSLSVSVVN